MQYTTISSVATHNLHKSYVSCVLIDIPNHYPTKVSVVPIPDAMSANETMLLLWINELYNLTCASLFLPRYFTMDAKRKCERKVTELATELWDVWPDGRSKAAHMFDAFYRMEYAPSRSLLQSASNVIVNGDISVQPQVLFGYIMI